MKVLHYPDRCAGQSWRSQVHGRGHRFPVLGACLPLGAACFLAGMASTKDLRTESADNLSGFHSLH